MKLLNQFNDFLSDVINLNSARITLLENSVIAIQNLISNSTWAPEIIEFEQQGSWAVNACLKVHHSLRAEVHQFKTCF